MPGAEMQAAHLAKTVSGDVQFTALEDVLTDILNATLQLDSVNGIAPLLSFATGGGGDPLYAFVPTDDWPGYAALSALWNYQNLLGGDLGYDGLSGIAAFDAIPIYLSGPDAILTYSAAVNGIPGYANALGGDFSGVSVFDGVTSFQNFPDQGLHAFVPVSEEEATDDNPAQAGYAALSGLYWYQQFAQSGDVSQLANIDAFSAIPNWKSFLSSGDISSEGLGGIDAFSAIPVFKAALEPNEPEPVAITELNDAAETPNSVSKKLTVSESDGAEPSGTATAPKLSNPVAALSSVTPASSQASEAGIPAVAPAAPAAPEASSVPAATDKSSGASGKQSNGSYSGVFKPNNPVVLFGTGKGGGADNGIRGWDKVANGIRGALGMPKDSSGSGDSDSSSGGE
ncbi:hypothetical protein BTO20_28730 [Mycobacterium dioxanotrophicus]|uniref:Uncharacterized protein n=1 Tax=Mycobacterium dioxanotrophicus TaxID=482462 RepID=A0A1Y0CAK8_9MYCO|nr:hypothetical protein BTO20_28730 [Mycobacterium dioxanotrophicus]